MSPRPAASARPVVRVAGLAISHPDKLWWPDEGITKLDVVRHYVAVEPLLRPWTKDRLLTAERCPDGMRGACFYQKNFARGLPAGTPTEPVRAETTGKIVHYAVGGSRRTLLALVNLGCIPLHLMNVRRGALDRPDWLAFDLDPGSGRFADAAEAAEVLRALLDDLGVRSYPKTSGGRGLHVLVPLRPGPDQATVRGFAMHVGRLMAERMTQGGSLLFGRRTYEDVLSYWNSQPDNAFASMLNGQQKYVASTTLREPLPRPNSALLQGDAADAVASFEDAIVVAELAQLVSGDETRDAGTEDDHLRAVGLAGERLRRHAVVARARLRLVEGLEIARHAQQRVKRVLGHLHRHAGVLQPHDAHVRRNLLHLEQGVHARSQVEQRLDAGLVLEQLDRRLPYQGDLGAGGRAVGIPDGNATAGHGGLQARDPDVGVVQGAGEEDMHGVDPDGLGKSQAWGKTAHKSNGPA